MVRNSAGWLKRVPPDFFFFFFATQYAVSISFHEARGQNQIYKEKGNLNDLFISFSHSYIVTSFPSIDELFISKQCFSKGMEYRIHSFKKKLGYL